ncbi:MAG TPA: hypothetical protein VJY41_02410 [Prolixibacteraceae bacterium]|nr:hypothetical protein [Prolixibacteraceae bacterium]
MKNKITYIILAFTLITMATLIVVFNFFVMPAHFEETEKQASIFPEYQDIVIPLNIAPLNFKINEPGKKQIVSFSTHNYTFKVKAKNGNIVIPRQKWRKLLNAPDQTNIHIDIYNQHKKGQWIKYPTINNTLSTDTIDSHIVFRHISAGYILWGDMGIYQRNIESYKKTPVLLNNETNNNCMHCHTFHKNDPSKMLIHLRGGPNGTLLYNDGKVSLINTKTKYTMAAGVYPAWHPNGNIIAFSVNLISQKFHTAGYEDITVFDQASDIITYNIKNNEISTSPKISTQSMENLPNWSPDGKHLYYISSGQYQAGIEDTLVKYDLLRIAYNEIDGSWGQVDTILTAAETGKSISFPEVSPNGKYLLFCMSNFGYFTIHRKSSDLYLMDLETMQYQPLKNVNSEYTESFHSWSSNSKWFLFVSKRIDGLYSRVYFCHVDKNGMVSNPILLPQKHANYYENSTINYNRPVFIKRKIEAQSYQLSKKAFEKVIETNFDPSIDINALSGATRIKQPTQ